MRYAVAFNPENLMSLCKECHAELHKKGTTHGYELPKVNEISNSYENNNPKE